MGVELIGPEKTKIEKIVKMKPRIENIASYESAILEVIPWMKEGIHKSPDKKIRIKVKDIAKVMGKDFEKKEYSDIYWGLKYALFMKGIVVDSGRTIPEGDYLLIMRMANENDGSIGIVQKLIFF